MIYEVYTEIWYGNITHYFMSIRNDDHNFFTEVEITIEVYNQLLKEGYKKR